MGERGFLRANIRVLVREWIIETPDGQENLVDHHCTVAFMDIRDFDTADDCLTVRTHDAFHIIPMSNILHAQVKAALDIQDTLKGDLEDDIK